MTEKNPSGVTERNSRALNIVWLQAGGCGGCTMALLGADSRDFFAALAAQNLAFAFHPSLGEATGGETMAVLNEYRSGRAPLDILCVEGAIQRGPAGSGRYQLFSGTGQPMAEWIAEMATRARYVLAIGSCTAFGGINAAGDNATESCGLQFEGYDRGGLLGADWQSASGLPVINVAGCPTHDGWVIETLMRIAGDGLSPADLDDFGRPRLFADHLVHHGCPRNEFYEFKASAQQASDQGCLMENLGCMGTQAHADCNLRPWNGVGSCVRGGFPCIACTEPGFESPAHPFLETPKIAGIPTGLPSDMPKAWFVALAALSKSATPKRVRDNAVADRTVVPPTARRRSKQ
jgi:ferredoxin hydrogenase small subunit